MVRAAATMSPASTKDSTTSPMWTSSGRVRRRLHSPSCGGQRSRVVSRHRSDEAWAWESGGIDGYDIKPAEARRA